MSYSSLNTYCKKLIPAWGQCAKLLLINYTTERILFYRRKTIFVDEHGERQNTFLTMMTGKNDIVS